jgi:hypothetical protein
MRPPRFATERSALGESKMKLSLCALALAPFALATTACGGSDSPPAGNTTPIDAGVDAAPVVDAAPPIPDAAPPPVDAAPDVDNGSPSTAYPAPHPALPQVVSGGGAVLAHPKVVPIFYSDYDATLLAGASDFVTQLAAFTSYTTAALSEYGVAGLTAGTPIMLATPAPIGTATAPYDDSMIQSWLAAQLTAADLPLGAPDPNAIYTFFFPASTIISMGGGQGQASLSCQDFGGYHDNIDIAVPNGDGGVATQPIAYAVVPSCSDFGGLSGIDMVTGAGSHEIAEAATDPFPSEDLTGYSSVDDNHLVWELVLGGGEIGDMCAQNQDAFFKPTGFDYTVQRIWSNASATANHDPCVPAASAAYFNSAPNLTDTLALPFGGATTQGVKVLAGDTATIDIDLFSDAATSGPWTVRAVEPQTMMGAAATLDLSLDRTTGVNGEKLHLTIKTLTANSYGLSAFLLESTLGTQTVFWPGLVQTK